MIAGNNTAAITAKDACLCIKLFCMGYSYKSIRYRGCRSKI
jgi:hypothetical protein